MSDFDDFADDAADLFGLNRPEAEDLLDRLLADTDFDPHEDVLADYMPEAFEELGDTGFFDTEDYDHEDEGYDLDPDFPDDDWLDVGDIWELSAEYAA